MLREACGQEIINGEEQCNYGELRPAGQRGYGGGPARPIAPANFGSAPVSLGAFSGGPSAPPPVRRDTKPGDVARPPPSVNRGAKPGSAAPPPVMRGMKPK